MIGFLLLPFLMIPMSFAKVESGKSIVCDDAKPRLVRIAYSRVSVINFPFRPKEVVPGQLVFDFKQIKNDLVIKALKPNGRTNVFVYMEDRRCAFDLVTVQANGDDILTVRDPKESQFEVKFHE
jgi:hypothetical protein